ncbi:unnamed protein product [Auanema sp. JU1783]|nr:unnamed protein product [Auanema sp. JU1783]
MDIGRAVSACQTGTLDSLEELLQAGLDVNEKDPDDCSLLHWAAINNRVPICQRLLKEGADPNVIGGVLKSTPLHWAVRVGSLGACAVLVKSGAVCNIRDTQGYTPIHLAVQGQHINVVAYLLEKFDCASLTDNSGTTPVMWAAFRCFSIFPIRLILRKNVDVNIKEDLQGNTALHLAAQERNYVAVSELLKAGADVTVRNKQQETALDIARTNRNHKIIGLLEETAIQQGVLPRRFCDSFKFVRKPVEFVLPGLIFLLTAFLFYSFHYGLAAALLGSVLILCFKLLRFEMHGPDATLIPIGICVSEPILMLILWITKVHWYATWWLQIAFILLLVALFITLIKISLGDPGVVPKNQSAAAFVESVESLCSRVTYCFFCMVDKPAKSKHCSVCDRCVKNFDHHCPWLHQCITKKNLRPFIVFAFCVGVSAAIFCGASINYSTTIIRYEGFDYFLESECLLILAIILSIFHAFALSMLFLQQCYQISSTTTTYEALMKNRSGVLPTTNSHSTVSEKPLTCSDRIKNLVEFCSGS